MDKEDELDPHEGRGFCFQKEGHSALEDTERRETRPSQKTKQYV